jgi:hypothetical protein
MVIHQKIMLDGVKYVAFEIKYLKWDLTSRNVFLVCYYYSEKKITEKEHVFEIEGETIEVDELIKELKKRHNV